MTALFTVLRRFSVPLTLTVLLTAAFYDVILFGKTFKVTTANSQAIPQGAYGQMDNKPRFIPVNGTDSPVMEEPVYRFISANLRRGIFPLWNPHQGCGFPLIGMLEIGVLFPLTWIMYIFPETVAWDILILCRFFLAGLFVYWMMRVFRFSRLPSLAAGVAFMLSGPMVLLQYWTANVDILAPVVILTMERLIRRPDNRRMAFFAVGAAMTIFAGHPEHIFLVNVYALFFLFYRINALKRWDRSRDIFPRLIAGYTLAAGLAAIVLFPFLYNLVFEFWHGHPPDTGITMEEQRARALSLALPHFFQDVPLTYQWSFSGWWGGYLGTMPLALAVLSLFRNHKKGLNYFFAAMAFLIVSKEYGLPYIDWIGRLPLFNICRYAIHTPHLAAFSVAALAGMGVRTLLCARGNLFKTGAVFSLALLGITLAHLAYLRTSPDISLGVKAAAFAALVLAVYQAALFLRDRGIISRRKAALALTALLFVELFAYIHRERPRRFASFPAVPYIEHLRASPERVRSYGVFWAFYPNTATGFGVDDLGYFFGLVPERYVTFVNSLLIPNHFRNDFRPPALRAIPVQGKKFLLDLLNVRYIIAPADDWMKNFPVDIEELKTVNKTVYSREVNIFERTEAFPRAFLVYKALFVPNRGTTMDLLGQMGPELRDIALLDGPANDEVKKALEFGGKDPAATAVITSYLPDRVTVRVSTASPALLVLADAFHPDWKAYVDAAPSEIFLTDGLIRSVLVPAGQHHVTFIFAPASFRTGGWVSALSWVLVLVLAGGWAGLRRRFLPAR